MNMNMLKLLIAIAAQAGPLVAALEALDKAVTENAPLDQHAKDVLTAVDDFVGVVIKAL